MAAEAIQRPCLPTFEGIPVDIRVEIYRNILLTDDASVSLRSAPEMRAQMDPKLRRPSLAPDPSVCPDLPDPCGYVGFADSSARPVRCGARSTLAQNTGILCVSRQINREATHVLCAGNNFHYSCVRSSSSFPGAGAVDPLQNDVPWLTVPFSDAQLHFMKSLSLDYCSSHYDRWSDAAVSDIDGCIARNIGRVDEACPSLRAFSLYIFSRPPLTAHFHRGRLGTGQAAAALGKLRRRLDSLRLVSTMPGDALAAFGQTIAPGAVWRARPLSGRGPPDVTVCKWQLRASRYRAGDRVRVFELDCGAALKDEGARGRDADPGDAEEGGSRAEGGQGGDGKTGWDNDEVSGASIFGSG